MPVAHLISLTLSPKSAPLVLIGGEVALYISVLMIQRLLCHRRPASPTRRAIAYAIPTTAAVLTAMIFGRPDVALSILFGVCVAVMSGVTGFIALSAPLGGGPAHWRRLWPFAPVAALLVFLGGFHGLLDWKLGLSLLIEGLVLTSLWSEPEPQVVGNVDAARNPPSDGEIFWWIPCGLLIGFGAWAAVVGALRLPDLYHTQNIAPLSPNTIAATMLSAALALPLIESGRRAAIAGNASLPLSAHVGLLIFCLCLLLSLVCFWPYAQSLILHHTVLGVQPNPFPGPNWRIDTVALVLLGLIQLPAALGKWSIDRTGGMVLVFAYVAYIMLTLMSPVVWG